MEAGCVGRRCYLSSVHHSTSAGASVYGHDWNSPFECVNDAGAFLRITSVADKGLVDTTTFTLINLRAEIDDEGEKAMVGTAGFEPTTPTPPE